MYVKVYMLEESQEYVKYKTSRFFSSQKAIMPLKTRVEFRAWFVVWGALSCNHNLNNKAAIVIALKDDWGKESVNRPYICFNMEFHVLEAENLRRFIFCVFLTIFHNIRMYVHRILFSQRIKLSFDVNEILLQFWFHQVLKW